MSTKPRDIEAWLNALGAPSADRDYKPGHERVLALIHAIKKGGLSFNQPKLRVRIAGTNGKGSTAHFLAAALQANGLKVGLYTSPHILSFHERMRINQQPISQDELIALVENVMPLALEVGTSYFETATVLALLYFSQQHVDIEILEAGVGAKLDATTALPADVGLLTPVALDHQDWLGDTLTMISQDKAYVFEGCKIQISASQSEEVSQVLDKALPYLVYAKPFAKPLTMLGEHQRINAGLAFAAIQAMRNQLIPLDITKAEQAMLALDVAGRLEQVQIHGNTFFLDAAHNEHAIEALLPTLAALPKFDVLLLATREDRDLSACIPQLETLAHKLVVMTGNRHDYQTVTQALDAEIDLKSKCRVLVLGSFITLAACKHWLGL